MPLETQANEVPFSPGKGVDVNKIEKELAALWSGASETGEVTSTAGVTRACALNLIIYTTPWEDRGKLEELLDRINEQHPGRALILVVYRDSEIPKLEGYVSMRCRLLGSNGKQICGEQVTIEASGQLIETAATAVAPLLVPDVPVFLWWNDIPHYEDKLFDRLSQMSDRLIIDSAAFDHPYDDLLRLRQVIGDKSLQMRVSDLNWGRLTSWRTLLASFWDVPDYRPLLDEIDRVEVKYRSPQEAPTEIAARALLLVGWLASRLGWEVAGKVNTDGEDISEWDLRAGSHTIRLSYQRDKTAGLSDGMISSVVLAKNGVANFSVAKPVDGTKMETEAQIGAERSVERVLTYEQRSEAEQLSRELAFLNRDAIYEAAVEATAQLVETIRK